MCTVHTHTNAEHTHAHTQTHTRWNRLHSPGNEVLPESKEQHQGEGGFNVAASRLLRTNTSIHRILYTWEIKNGWCKLQPSYKEPSCKLPSYTAAIPAVPHCAPSAKWIHQCCSGWPDHNPAWCSAPRAAMTLEQSPSSALFPPKHRGMAGVQQKALLRLVLSLLF